jgi:DNA-binding NarL/FixJ family response regulator
MQWTNPSFDLDDLGDPGGNRTSVSPSPGCVIRVAIADGQALVRAGFHALLEGQDDITVVGEAGDGESAIALAGHARPDVLLMDLGLPGIDGLEATRRILADPELAELQVLILTTAELDEHLLGALRAGASGFLAKDTQASQLIEAVRAVACGEALLSRRATRRLIAEIASQPDPRCPSPEQLEELTAREREVMALVAAGLSNHEIAESLVVSVATARTHVSRALRKAGARDRAQLVALAYETGLVQPRRDGTLQSAVGRAGRALTIA